MPLKTKFQWRYLDSVSSFKYTLKDPVTVGVNINSMLYIGPRCTELRVDRQGFIVDRYGNRGVITHLPWITRWYSPHSDLKPFVEHNPYAT